MISDGQQLFQTAGFLQLSVTPGDIATNLAGFWEHLARLAPPAGTLLVLPEMWASGFVYEQLDALSGETPALLLCLQESAARYGIVLAGSMIERLGPAAYANTLYVVGEKGVLGSYRKQQPFRRWREDQYFQAGLAPAPILTGFGSLGGLVCYDLRFPDLARHHCQRGADLLLCAAMWPAGRIGHWRTLLQARAIENQTMIIGCNAVGFYGETALGGHSLIVSADGEILVEASELACGRSLSLDWAVQAEVRSRFNSFGEDVYRTPDAAKIVSIRACLNAVRQRRKAGQRGTLIHCTEVSAATVAGLQQARLQADFLVVLIPSGASAADMAESLAALGCVGYVAIYDDGNDDDQAGRQEFTAVLAD